MNFLCTFNTRGFTIGDKEAENKNRLFDNRLNNFKNNNIDMYGKLSDQYDNYYYRHVSRKQ